MPRHESRPCAASSFSPWAPSFSIILALWSDWREVQLRSFPWQWLPLIVGLALINYVVRIFRWHWWLGLVGVTISRWDSTRIFGVGSLGGDDAGQSGRGAQGVHGKECHGNGGERHRAIIVTERIIDGIATMLILASIGLIAFPEPRAQLCGGRPVGCVCRRRRRRHQIRPLALPRWPLRTASPSSKFSDQLYAIYESSYSLFRPSPPLIALSLGIIAWGTSGLAFGGAVGFGAPMTWGDLHGGLHLQHQHGDRRSRGIAGGLGGFEGSAVFWWCASSA